MLVLWLEELVLGQFLLLLCCLLVRRTASRISRCTSFYAALLIASFGRFVVGQQQQQQQQAFFGDRVVDAINCGGPAHRDGYGIQYRKDPLGEGIASDHGRQYIIQRVSEMDRALYQTERYSFQSLDYKIRIPDDGQYVLVLKFSEVYFEGPNLKVFDVFLNGHNILKELDIFALVGKAVAHDELIDFTVSNSKLTVDDFVTSFGGELVIQLKKGKADNPKLNALYVMRGRSADIPPLPPLRQFQEEQARLARRHGLDVDEDEEVDEELDGGEQQQQKKSKQQQQQRKKTAAEDEEERQRREKLVSGRKLADPYAQQDHSQMFLPILIALAAFFPVLFCLCKL